MENLFVDVVAVVVVSNVKQNTFISCYFHYLSIFMFIFLHPNPLLSINTNQDFCWPRFTFSALFSSFFCFCFVFLFVLVSLDLNIKILTECRNNRGRFFSLSCHLPRFYPNAEVRHTVHGKQVAEQKPATKVNKRREKN